MRSPFTEISDDDRSVSDVSEQEYEKDVKGRQVIREPEPEPEEELKVESDEEGDEEQGEDEYAQTFTGH